ncbi:MAG TPA: bifunctional nuclease family protein [Kiritimatiellia bacterium]|nr:bifunctional nuclease family protein [Kiritimatiellia bacterium]
MTQDIPVSIKTLLPTPSGCGVFLTDGVKVISIFVDHSVAAAITMALHEVHKPRPLTHDLIANIFAGLGVSLQKIVINDLKEDTFYARLFLIQENELGRSHVEIDARPSDSIALALQTKCPIFVAQAVWERAEDMSWALEQKAQEEEGEDDEDGEEEVP